MIKITGMIKSLTMNKILNLLHGCRYLCLLSGLIMVFSLIGCTRVIRLDSSEFKPTYEYDTLIFQTDTLSKSRWYLLTDYNLRLEVYQAKADESGTFQYIGTAILTKEANIKNIFIPYGTDVYLLAEYSDYVVGLMSMCRVSVCFHPKQGETYKLIFNHESKSCKLILIDVNSPQPVAPCTSSPKNDVLEKQ